jgi:hypothetical protein
MRATHDQQISLFGGERIAPSYRGRRSSQPMPNAIRFRIAIAFAATVIGFTTAATAITIKHSKPAIERTISPGANLTGRALGSSGFEAALY